MIYADLAAEVVAALDAMTPLQREGIRRSLNVPNLALPENAALWEVIAPATQDNDQTNDSPLEDVRAALEDLPPDSWRALNNALFILYRGNIFDEPARFLEGGGIDFRHDDGMGRLVWGARYELFFSYLEAERQRLKATYPYTRQIVVDPLAVLDVGCWQGTLMCEMMQRGYATGGTDICSLVQPDVRDRVSHLRAEDRNFLGFTPGWAHEIIPTLGLFDIVTCQETLEHIPASVLQQTCDAILGAARYSVLIELPGWDDGWPLHLRVYTIEELYGLFARDGWRVEVLQVPGPGVYTMVKMVRE